MARNGLDGLLENGSVGGGGRGSEISGFLSRIPLIGDIPEALTNTFGGVVFGSILHQFWGWIVTKFIPIGLLLPYLTTFEGFVMFWGVLYVIDKSRNYLFIPFIKRDAWAPLFLGFLFSITFVNLLLRTINGGM